MKKLGVIVSCYDKIDDTLAQLDILSFDPYKRPVIVSYMGYEEPPKEFSNYHLVHFPSPGFTSGPLMSLVHSLRKAHELGLDYVLYRNGDDWFFNHELTEQWFRNVVANDYLCAGYNWFGANNYHDITMNELIISVPHFMETADRAVEYFFSSDQRFTCEYKMAWWVNATLTDMDKQFWRLPDREQEHGVGRLISDVPTMYRAKNKEVPEKIWTELNDNNRFFCRKWQMIGSHLNLARFIYWTMLRDEIPYRAEIENKPHFNRWLRSIAEKKVWNTKINNISRLGRQDRKYYPIRTVKTLPKKLLTGRYAQKFTTEPIKIVQGTLPKPPEGVNPVLYIDNM